MHIFLRLFAQYRLLEAQLQEAASARISAEDNARLWRAKADDAEEKWAAERAENKFLSRSVIDHQAISAGQLPIFGVVPVPPPNEDAGALHGNPPRRLMREVQAERIAQSRRAAVDRIQAMANGDVTASA